MAKMIRNFVYQKRDASTVRERANQRGGDFDSIFRMGVKLFKPRDGRNLIRILPPTFEGAQHYGLEIWVNYGVGVDNQSYLSLSKMKNERDPLAEARKQAEREGNKEIAKKLTPSKRVLMWVIDRNAEEEGPQLWSAPWTIDKDFCNLSFDEDTREVIMVDDPEEGCDIRFNKEGTGLTTKYDGTKMKIQKPSSLHENEDLMNDWLEYVQANPLPEVLNFYDYDHISLVFDGHVASRSEDETVTVPVRTPLKAEPEDDLNDEREFLNKVADRKSVKSVEPDDDDDHTPSRIRERLMAKRSAPQAPPFDPDEEPVKPRATAPRR